MGELVATAAGTGGVTLGLTILINLFRIWSENRKQDAIITRQITETHIAAMDAAAKRGASHPVTLFMAALGRFMLLTTSLGILVFMTVFAAHNSEIPLYLPENEPYALRILGFTLLELDVGATWGEFSGIVVFPIWFAIIGGCMGYWFGQAPFDRK